MRRFLALLAAAALLLAACGDSGPDPADDPEGALRSALESLGNSEGLTLTITLNSTEESLVAASEGELPADAAAKILDSSIVFSGKGDTPENSSFEMLVNIAGTDGFEIKAVDQEVYLRADVRGIAETFGAPLDELEAGLGEAEAQGFTFVRPAIEGEWLHLAGAKELAEQLGGMAGAPSPDAKVQQQAADALAKALDESSTVTSEGSDDIGDHLVAIVNLRSFYSGITETMGTLSQLPAGQLPPASEVPDADLKLDVWIADDMIEQIQFDFLQLAQIAGEDAEIPEGVDQLGIQLSFDEFDGDVEVPGDAVDVDLQQIFQGFMGSMTGGSSAGSSEIPPVPETDMSELCEQLKEAPDDVKKQFAEQCPDLVP